MWKGVTVAISAEPDPLHGAIAERIGALIGRAPERVPGADDHEIYLSRPEILAGWLASRVPCRPGAGSVLLWRPVPLFDSRVPSWSAT